MSRRPVKAMLALSLLAGACSRPQQPAPMPAATPEPVTQATPLPTPVGVQIVSLELGRAIGADKRVTDPATLFKPTDTIYLSVVTDGTTSASEMTARFVYGPDSQLVNESTQTLVTSGTAVTEFHVAKADGWPPGTYAVDVTLAGTTRRAEFRVE